MFIRRGVFWGIDMDDARSMMVNRGKAVFGALAGSLYLFFGIVEMAVWAGYDAGWTSSLFIPGDMGGFVLIIISAVFFWGVKESWEGIREGAAYVYMGILLSLLFGLIYLLIMGADAMGHYILGADESWNLLNSMRPALYLSLAGMAGLMIWRDKFELKGM